MFDYEVVQDDTLPSTEMRATTPDGSDIEINAQNCFDIVTALPLGSLVAVPPTIFRALREGDAFHAVH